MDADKHPCQLVEKYMATTKEAFDLLLNNMNAWLVGNGVEATDVTGLQQHGVLLGAASAVSDLRLSTSRTSSFRRKTGPIRCQCLPLTWSNQPRASPLSCSFRGGASRFGFPSRRAGSRWKFTRWMCFRGKGLSRVGWDSPRASRGRL